MPFPPPPLPHLSSAQTPDGARKTIIIHEKHLCTHRSKKKDDSVVVDWRFDFRPKQCPVSLFSKPLRVLLRELDTRVSSVFRFTIASWLFPIVLGGIELHGRSAKG